MSRESPNMKSLVYECDVEWLRPFVEGGSKVSSAKAIKWQKLEDLIVVGDDKSMGPGDTNIIFRMLVTSGGVYKGWVEVRKSGASDGYGLFAVTRFEKGSIVTAKIPYETQLSDSAIPTKDTLHLGWNWIVKKNVEEVGRNSNAVYLKESGLIRACTRIMPGTEILMDKEESSVSNGLEWLDSLIFAEPQHGWTNWHARKLIGKVVSGDKGRGFVVKYDDGSMQNMTEMKLEELAVSHNVVVRNKLFQSHDAGGKYENRNKNETEVKVTQKKDVGRSGRSMEHVENKGHIEKKRKKIE